MCVRACVMSWLYLLDSVSLWHVCILFYFIFNSDSLFTKFYNKESVLKAVSIQT